MSKKPHVEREEAPPAPPTLPDHLREGRDERRELLDAIAKCWDHVRAENHRLRKELESK